MKTYLKLAQWGSHHHPRWLILIRVLLGFLLLAKGIDFLKDIAQLESILQNSRVETNFPYLAFVIAWSHFMGGLFIIIGLFTRAVVLIQVPIIVGALFFSQSVSEWAFAAIVFLLLLVFLLEGSGPFSMDRHYFKKNTSLTGNTA